jgi:hypothetical protein
MLFPGAGAPVGGAAPGVADDGSLEADAGLAGLEAAEDLSPEREIGEAGMTTIEPGGGATAVQLERAYRDPVFIVSCAPARQGSPLSLRQSPTIGADGVMTSSRPSVGGIA